MRALLLLALAAPATALADEGEFEVGVYGGVLLTDQLETMGNGLSVIPRVSYKFSPGSAVEVDLGYLSGKTLLYDRAYTAFTPRVYFRGHMLQNQVLDPVMSVGMGALYRKVQDDEPFGPEFTNPDVDFALSAGPGLRLPIGSSLVVRTDYKFLLTLGSENYERKGDSFLDWEWTAGVAFRWGGAKDTDKDGLVDDDEKPECVDKPEDFDGWEDNDGCPDEDNDGDGVLDVNEGRPECANEKEDVDGFEDEDGCPDPDNDGDGIADGNDECALEAGTPEARGCPDADGDAIADGKDACPDKPGDSKWEGCPDTDRDGIGDNTDECPKEAGPLAAGGCADADADNVKDADDKCKDESAGMNVDRRFSDGCPAPVYVALGYIAHSDPVTFGKGSTKLQSSGRTVLDAVVGLLQARPEIERVEIGVYTDDKGSSDAAGNEALSVERGKVIATYLVGKGIPEARLQLNGYGLEKEKDQAEDVPLDRVVFKIITLKVAEAEAPAEEKPAEETPAEGGATKGNTGDGTGKMERPDDKPAEEKPAEEKPAEEKPAEGK